MTAPLRSGLLAAARSPRLARFAARSRMTKPVVERFVAGVSEAEALQATEAILNSGRLVTLDFLGEDVQTRETVDITVEAYRQLLASLGSTGLADRAEVSVKLSAIGQAFTADADKISLDNARAICAAAVAVGTTVTLDMEDHTTTDATPGTLQQLRVDFLSAGAVVQAYLRRTEADCRDLATVGSRVRLCKGAYAEPDSVAYTGPEVDESYRRCLQVLIEGAGYPMIATHDPAMVDAAKEMLGRRAADSYEFQMLLGVRTDEQLSLSTAGHAMRVYLPFGQQWCGYFMRRLAERPANLKFFLRSVTSKR